jgi:hypothetical protein
MKRIAALFVEAEGPYSSVDFVDLYDVSRDARACSGPHPVVAHPPCTRWGRYWPGGPSARARAHKGDDQGCFAAALFAVRTFGGVLEHPEASHAWAWYGIERPSFHGGWVKADAFGGWPCCVAQGHYGHPSQKMTWLYTVGCPRPELQWGRAPSLRRLDEGFHSKEERRRARSEGATPRPRLSSTEKLWTPAPFRDVLLEMALASECQ